jgi:branched-chain amino acid transport system ATP-binding protein
VLQVNNLNAFYGESHVLHDVSLRVNEGHVTVLLGRNRMGKTTTINSIMGVHTSKKGVILLEEKEIHSKPSFEISKSGVGFVPQGRRIFANLTVRENLMTTFRPEKDGWTLAKIYKLFPKLAEKETLLGESLNEGEKLMLSIGRALLTNPKLLLIDEPSEGLSRLMIKEMIAMIKFLKQQGLTILLVEKNTEMTLEVADHIYIINEGSIVFNGESDFVNNEVKTKFLAVSS